MSVQITWIGHASFRLAGDSVVYVDPWKLQLKAHDADIVFVSHPHSDHYSADDVEIVSGQSTCVLCPPGTVPGVPAENLLSAGRSFSAGQVSVEAVPAYNTDKDFHPKANGWLGAVFTIGGARVYYAGDTDVIPEMAELSDIDVALLPVGGTYTMDADQAVAACERIGCAAAIPYHWGDIVGSVEDAKRFTDCAGCQVHLLQPGQSVTI